MAGLAANYDKFKMAGVEIVAISVDAKDKSVGMADQLKLPFGLLSDPDHKVIDSYGILDPAGKISRAAVFIVDKKGIVRWVNVSEDYKVRPLEAVVLAELSKIN